MRFVNKVLQSAQIILEKMWAGAYCYGLTRRPNVVHYALQQWMGVALIKMLKLVCLVGERLDWP